MSFAASAKLACLLSCSALLSAGTPRTWTDGVERSLLGFADDDITPDTANSARFPVEQEGQRMSATGSHEQAAELYWLRGVELKDPVLIIDAGEAWLAHANVKRSIESANNAVDRSKVALDMLYFLRDGATSKRWQPIAPEYLDVVIDRAQTVITDANTLIAEIEAEQARAAEAANAPVEAPRKRAKPGTGLIAGGSAAVVLGLGGAGLGVAGLVLGAAAQRDVEDPLVYPPEHMQAEARGRQANVLAGVGLAVAGVGVGVGAALIVLGLKKRRAAGDDRASREGPGLWAGGCPKDRPSAMLLPSFGRDGVGLSLVGRF